MSETKVSFTDLNGKRYEDVESYNHEGDSIKVVLKSGETVERVGRTLVTEGFFIAGVWDYFWGFMFIVEA